VRILLAPAILAVAIAVVTGCGGGSDDGAPGGGALSRSAGPAPKLSGIPQHGTSLGQPRAPATMVEFTDLRCRPCEDFEYDVLPTLVKRYVRPGRLRLELRVIGLGGKDSLEAAAWAAAAAKQDRLYQFVEAFFRGQGQPGESSPVRVAARAGLDVPRARRYALSRKVKAALARTTDQARSSGITAPPKFYVARGRGALQPFPVNSQVPDDFTRPLDRLIAGG
jgi:protein-disulfide isomerase